MELTLGRAMRRLGYTQTRALLVITGLAILLAVAAVSWVRRVESVEVVATLLFLPVFLPLVVWKTRGGIAAGVLAAGVYTVLRVPAIEAVGLDRFLGLILSRGAALVAFGAIGGWAVGQVERSVRKLDAVDWIDDLTGLHNARFFVQETELELARARRYDTTFSVAAAEIPAKALNGLSGRRAERTLRELGRTLGRTARRVDRGVHALDESRHRLAVILPETGRDGARVFADRFAHRLTRALADHGVSIGPLQATVLTLPEDAEELEVLREEFRRIDRAERPDAPAPEEALPG